MPTPKQALVALITGDPTTMGYLTGGFFPDQGPENEANWLAYQVVSDRQQKLLNGTPIGIRRVLFQLTARLDTRLNTDNVEAAIRALLDGKVNKTLGGLMVKSSVVNDDDEGAVDEDESPRPGEDSGNRVVRFDVIWWI